MSSKYLNLPDVDTSAPDVYESAEPLGPSEANDPYGSGDDLFPIAGSSKQHGHQAADIDASHLPRREVVAGSFGRRKAGGMTYSYRPPRLRLPIPTHRPSRVHHLGGASSSPSSSDNDDDNDGAHTHETPHARLRRLKWEMDELERDLKSGAADETGAGKRKGPAPEVLLEQLAGLRTSVGEMDGRVGVGGANDSKRAEGRSVDEQLEDLGKAVDIEAGTAANEPRAMDEATGPRPPGAFQAASDIDKRLEVVERAIGAGTGLDDSSALPRPILPTLSRLEQLVALLAQPRQLDAVSRRVKLLLADLDRAGAVTAKRAAAGGSGAPGAETGGAIDEESTLTPAERDKLEALFALLPRVDPLLTIVPPLLDRLRSLGALHASAAGWDATLRKLEGAADALDAEDGELDEVVARVEAAIVRESEAVRGNWKSLEGRLGDVERRLQAVHGP